MKLVWIVTPCQSTDLQLPVSVQTCTYSANILTIIELVFVTLSQCIPRGANLYDIPTIVELISLAEAIIEKHNFICNALINHSFLAYIS